MVGPGDAGMLLVRLVWEGDMAALSNKRRQIRDITQHKYFLPLIAFLAFKRLPLLVNPLLG
jgi:hypothetical protein